MACSSSFVGAVKNYFGLRPGQTTNASLAGELKQLSPQDRVDIAHGLVKAGALDQKGLEKELAKHDAALTPSEGY